MADRPILYSGQMVRAQLEGRKTQTRRGLYHVVKIRGNASNLLFDPRYPYPIFNMDAPQFAVGEGWTLSGWQEVKEGDRLWVRETFAGSLPGKVIYRASAEEFTNLKWSPAIHMPRALSRITNVVTGVKIERLQDLTETDAEAEGWPYRVTGGRGAPLRDAYPIGWYGNLWEDLNGKGSWDANPWVVAVAYEVHVCNIDEMKDLG